MKKNTSAKKVRQLEKRVHRLEEQLDALEERVLRKEQPSYVEHAISYCTKYAWNFAKVYGVKLALDFMNSYLQALNTQQPMNGATGSCLTLSNGLSFCNPISLAFGNTLAEPPKFMP